MSKFDSQSFADDIGKATQEAADALSKISRTGTNPSQEIAAMQATAILNATNALAAALTLLEGIADGIRAVRSAIEHPARVAEANARVIREMVDDTLHRGAQMEGAPDPAAPGFENLVTDTARALWKADPGNRTAARTFDEDYAASQDRYTEMARRFLDPTEDGTR